MRYGDVYAKVGRVQIPQYDTGVEAVPAGKDFVVFSSVHKFVIMQDRRTKFGRIVVRDLYLWYLLVFEVWGHLPKSCRGPKTAVRHLCGDRCGR